MVSTRKKRQSGRRLLSQIDDIDQDMIIGNAASESQDFTVSTSSNNTAVNASTVNVKTLERCFNERIDREMSIFVDTVEDRIQNAILVDIENIVAPKIEVAIRSINASSARVVTNVTANSERGEHVGINAPFESASENNNIMHVSNVNDETRHNILDEISELSVPETRFDRQAHTHQVVTGPSYPNHHMVTGPSNPNHHMVTGPSNPNHHMVTGQKTQTNQIPEFLTGHFLALRNPPSHQHQNLSTQVSQDNNLPMVEQTPRNQNFDASNSINGCIYLRCENGADKNACGGWR